MCTAVEQKAMKGSFMISTVSSGNLCGKGTLFWQGSLSGFLPSTSKMCQVIQYE